MIFYLYALGEGLPSLDDVTGGAGEPLAPLIVEELTVVAGRLPEVPPVDEAALAAQDRVVRMLHGRSDALLPMRFGAAFPSLIEVERAVSLQAPILRRQLARVRHRDQMTLRVFAREQRSSGADGQAAAPDAHRARSGTEYLHARAASITPAAIKPLLASLDHLQRGTHVAPGRARGIVATVYQLIDRGTSAAYEAAVQAAAERHPELSLRVSGPSPCYAFAAER